MVRENRRYDDLVRRGVLRPLDVDVLAAESLVTLCPLIPSSARRLLLSTGLHFLKMRLYGVC